MKYEDFNNDSDSASNYSDNEDDQLAPEAAGAVSQPLGEMKCSSLPIAEAAAMVKGFTNRGFIDLSPTYQREEVWSSTQCRELIDSIVNNYYIPPVIFSRIQDEQDPTRTIYRCIDGKQRLSTLRKFFDGEVSVSEGDKKCYYWKQPHNRQKLVPLLRQEARDYFMKKKILFVAYDELTESQEREVFTRVQAGKPLNRAEKLKASVGRNSVWLSETVDDKFSVNSPFNSNYPNKDKHVPYNTSRAKPYEFLCILAMFIEKWMDQKRSTTSPSLRQLGGKKALEAWLQSHEELSHDVKERISAVIDKLNDIARSDDTQIRQCLHYYFHRLPPNCTPTKVVKENISLSPVEMIFICVLIHRQMDQPDVGLLELSTMIKGMRTEICEKYKKDRTLNDARAAVCLRFIVDLERPGKTEQNIQDNLRTPSQVTYHPSSFSSNVQAVKQPLPGPVDHHRREDIPSTGFLGPPARPTPLPNFLPDEADLAYPPTPSPLSSPHLYRPLKRKEMETPSSPTRPASLEVAPYQYHDHPSIPQKKQRIMFRPIVTPKTPSTIPIDPSALTGATLAQNPVSPPPDEDVVFVGFGRREHDHNLSSIVKEESMVADGLLLGQESSSVRQQRAHSTYLLGDGASVSRSSSFITDDVQQIHSTEQPPHGQSNTPASSPSVKIGPPRGRKKLRISSTLHPPVPSSDVRPAVASQSDT